MTIVPRFLWNAPSWLIELFSGLLCVFLAVGISLLVPPFMRRPLVILLPHALSLIYEFVFDSNIDHPGHLPWSDIRERETGILLGLLVWSLTW